MYGYYHEHKKRELDALKAELKTLTPDSSRYIYVKEQIPYLISDLYELENKK